MPWLLGDFSGGEVLDGVCIDRLSAQAALGQNEPLYDVNADGEVNVRDINTWVGDFAKTWIGDIDGEFNSNDLMNVFRRNKYETDESAVWSDGDWNGDGRFGSPDLVAAFQDGGYERGARPARQVVPESNSTSIFVIGVWCILATRRRMLLQIGS